MGNFFILKKNTVATINRKLNNHKRLVLLQFTVAFLMLSMGIGIGFFVSDATIISSGGKITSDPLRLKGQQFTSPLLACNRVQKDNSPRLEKISQPIHDLVSSSIAQGSITAASIYVRLLESGEEYSFNPDERFFPASLRKLPLMMQLMHESEADTELLSQKKSINSISDANLGTIIPPKLTPEPQKEYSALELIEYMIKYSDNTSFQLLYSELGEDSFRAIYAAMQLEYPENFSALEDHRTAMEYSLFFRTLYNATYLNVENSEKALSMLTQTDYVNGLVKQLPSDVLVAHKFGVAALKDASGTDYGELHDCGIVYAPGNPYIICIMTKSQSPDISLVEQVIAQISGVIFTMLQNK